jgi:eukaryotic-like serine/threonine-protein kinase
MAGDGEYRVGEGPPAGPDGFSRLGPHLLLRTSGAGGMGRIDLCLRAQPGGIAKLCVVKRMHAELRSPEQDARFRREANIALQLSHSAIAQTVGIEEIDGELLLLQELVHGVDVRLLQTRLTTAGQPVPLAIAIHVVSEIARALAYAHAFGDLGIVHRDVTPDNVMLAFSGEVKLVDFGIARSNVDATLTSTGHIVGRPTYTAPEVWDGAQADRRADIYSLGVVLWQLLTGRRFEDVRASGANRAPAPSAHNPELPARLDGVVARALAPDPGQRFQTAGELQEALRPFSPSDFLPEPALAELLARHFDVARERRMLASEVERARIFLGSVPKPQSPASAVAAEPESPTPAAPTAPARPERARTAEPTNGRRPKIIAAIGAVGLCAVAIIAGLRQPPSRPITPALPPPAVNAHQAVVGRVAPSPPPLTAAAHAAADEDDDARAQTRRPPARAHQIAASAGRARPAGTKAARRVPSPPSDELLRRAQEKFDVGETEAALALARRAAGVGVGAGAPAHVLMGKVMMSEHRFDEAEREFAEAVRLDPGDTKAARLLGLVRETRSGAP